MALKYVFPLPQGLDRDVKELAEIQLNLIESDTIAVTETSTDLFRFPAGTYLYGLGVYIDTVYATIAMNTAVQITDTDGTVLVDLGRGPLATAGMYWFIPILRKYTSGTDITLTHVADGATTGAVKVIALFRFGGQTYAEKPVG